MLSRTLKLSLRLSFLAAMLLFLGGFLQGPTPVSAAPGCNQVCYNTCVTEYAECELSREQCCEAANACRLACGTCPLICLE
jgi:hypothetical protein